MRGKHGLAAIGVLLAATGAWANESETSARLLAVAPALACASLTGIDLAGIGGPDSRVVSAAETIIGSRRICAVDGTLAPSVGFRVELPLDTWTQRLLQVGCGGYCGRIGFTVRGADACLPLAAGEFALAATDMGHQGRGTEFGRDPQMRADFAHRAIGVTAKAAKLLIAAFYGQAPAHSYFIGCSEGGRQAMIAAQRYPEAFDGIVAGGPTMSFQVQNSFYHAWQSRSNTGSDGRPILLAERLPILHEAVLAACDSLDGQTDRLVSAPAACRFDPGTLLCPEGERDRSRCLTGEELMVVRKLYDGPRDPATGERLTIGGPLAGSELSWAGVFVPRPGEETLFSTSIARETLAHISFEGGPNVSLEELRFDSSTFDRLRPRQPLFDATNPDLSAFSRRGGKLILWHGWADPHVAPAAVIGYYRAVEAELGSIRARDTLRLYMLPGLHHCVGGEGPSLVDFLTPLMAWVEKGQAPEAILTRQAPVLPVQASGSSSLSLGSLPVRLPRPDDPVRSRPVFPYPAMAIHDGRSDPNEPAGYRRAGPPAELAIEPWAGADFYRPYPWGER